jgi:hypothetical protein
MILFGLLLIPIIIASIIFFIFHEKITWKEFLIQVSFQTFIISCFYAIALHKDISDVQHIHGRITGKVHDSQSCCHCRQVCKMKTKVCSGSGRDKSCYSECSLWVTECDHSQDYYWSLNSTIGDFTIDSCEPNPNRTPKVWEEAYVGEPATRTSYYDNYLKIDPESIFAHKDFKKYSVPDFPQTYDFYKVDSITGSVKVPYDWNYKLNEINARLGRQKEVDIKIVTTWLQDASYAEAIESKWLYGPKNSLIIVLGINENKISWARVVTFSKVEELKIYLRDELQGKTLNDDVLNIIEKSVGEKFKRTSMSEYKYLLDSKKISTGWIIFLYILGTIMSLGISYLLHRHDLFGEQSYKKFY